MTVFDPYLPLEGVTRLYYRGNTVESAIDTLTTLPLYLEWCFPEYDFSAPASRRKPTLRAVQSYAGVDRSWHFVPGEHGAVAEPVCFRINAHLLSRYVYDFVRFVNFESPIQDVSFDPGLRDARETASLSVGTEVVTIPALPAGYRLLHLERLYRKPGSDATHHFGRRYTGCYVDPGAIRFSEREGSDGTVALSVDVECWGDIQTLSTFSSGVNIFSLNS